jgi:hypothetical protein
LQISKIKGQAFQTASATLYGWLFWLNANS